MVAADNTNPSQTDKNSGSETHGVTFLRSTQSDRHVQRALQIIETRRKRNETFSPHELFADPAWDIMLHVFVASERNRQISIKCACIASMVPASTAQRVISKLVDARLIKRTKDPQDTRRSFITLEPHARLLLEHILV